MFLGCHPRASGDPGPNKSWIPDRVGNDNKLLIVQCNKLNMKKAKSYDDNYAVSDDDKDKDLVPDPEKEETLDDIEEEEDDDADADDDEEDLE